MPTAPDIRNYTIGKGKTSFKPTGGEYRELGNTPEFEFTPAIEKLEHFSSRSGIRNRDRTEVLSKSGSLRIVTDEWDPKNVAMAVLGSIDTNTDGLDVIQIFSETAVSGSIKFEGTNDVGQKYTWEFLKVDFIPGSGINLISDEWGTLELSGDVSADETGSFGTVVHTGGEGADETA